jgi:CelD/BcsL family acetyltransferase involved in cellulose biosynthesis
MAALPAQLFLRAADGVPTVVVLITEHGVDFITARSDEFDRLAMATGSIYLSSAWLDSWTRAFAPRARSIVATDGAGNIRAAAVVRSLTPYGLGSAADLETDDWTVSGDDPTARSMVWQHLAQTARGRLQLTAVPNVPQHAGLARSVLHDQGYRVAERASVANPRLDLPDSWEDLRRSVSRNTRSLLQRRLAALRRVGSVRLRTSTPERVNPDLACFYQLEASGWKGRAGSAIVMRRRTRALYDRFARHAAREGWLRLQLLEVGGVAVAADLSCSFGGGVFMLKTGFDETWSRFSPGLVLRGEALRTAIDDGQQFYDFLGPADDYKLRWGAEVHPHVTISAFRGPVAPFAYRWHAQARPRLKVVRARATAAVTAARTTHTTRAQRTDAPRP